MNFRFLFCIMFISVMRISAQHRDSMLNARGADEPFESTGDTSNSDTTVVNKVDIKAKFPGGDEAFINFIRNNFEYPPRCQEEGINGYVQLKFIVDTKGVISNIEIMESTKNCPEFANEAIRVLKKSPRWIPGIINGKVVKSWRVVPIKLTLG